MTFAIAPFPQRFLVPMMAACIMLSANPVAIGAPSPADDHNRQGLALYKSGKLEEAAALFHRAITADPNHKWGHYNLACVYARLFECEQIQLGERMLDEREIYRHLEKAISLDRTFIERAKKDRDFERVYGKVGYLTTTGLSVKDPAHVRTILCSVRWYLNECSGGVYGCSTMTFGKDGTVRYNHYDPCEYAEGNDARDAERAKAECARLKKMHHGTFRIENSKIVVRFNNGETLRYAFPSRDGRIRETGGSKTRDWNLRDSDPNACSA
ncbi:MAG TPA: tetratricopeptide repeat protein [Spirochaetota bacterium]|nr:tetratricopeptide repeat protein [Spirochaetota bacterium]HOS39328.1 tetratricopeptide repeat protein [Spirochaetota bacterium]HPI24260.1 tetratricopeptide repeat protein [Spirochaetota bacterium]HPU88269.1 tetratricopeptide repeat protein [Spirochaetota bacterium]